VKEQKLNKISPFYFFGDSLRCGLKLGFLTGFPYWAFWWPYGPFGIMINMIFGIVLGGINSIILSFMLNNNIKFIYLFSIPINAIFNCFLYFFVFLYFDKNRYVGALIYALFPSTINAIIAGYILHRAARLYKTGKVEK
jgi:hypothetical protein